MTGANTATINFCNHTGLADYTDGLGELHLPGGSVSITNGKPLTLDNAPLIFAGPQERASNSAERGNHFQMAARGQ